MEEVRDGNPKQCFEMFCMSLRLFYHFVDELKWHGYLKEGKGHVDVQESVVIFLYIIGHNTRMQCVADRFNIQLRRWPANVKGFCMLSTPMVST